MRIERAKAGASDVVTIDADGSPFFIRVSYANELALALPAIGDELDEEAEARFRLCDEAYRAEKKGAELCGRAEQSKFNLSRKLAAKGFSPKAVALAPARLESEGFVDDARFAEAWLRSRSRSSADSPLQLRAGLQARGIDPELAKRALRETVSGDEQAAALERALKRYARKFETERELVAFLRNKGFDVEIIQNVLSRHDTAR